MPEEAPGSGGGREPGAGLAPILKRGVGTPQQLRGLTNTSLVGEPIAGRGLNVSLLREGWEQRFFGFFFFY